ncbi:MAG: endonuclease III [Clostridia bacterium]|nr:endonuclease III [Clostridia bacterium]
MNKKIVLRIIEKLQETYPDAKCSLIYNTPFELVVSVMLSAQCTDKRVNEVTKILFKRYNNPEKISEIPLQDLESIIKPCGFYKVKAKHIKGTAEVLKEQYKSQVPRTMEELTKLPGVGRKSANVILSEAFDTPVGIAVDTHVKRVSIRIGLSKQKDPNKIEEDLKKVIPKMYYKQLNHLLIEHGRNCCKAQNPKCVQCILKNDCDFILEQKWHD